MIKKLFAMPEDFPNGFGATCSMYVDLREEKWSDHKLFALFQKNGETTQFLYGGPSLYTLYTCSQPVFSFHWQSTAQNGQLPSPLSNFNGSASAVLIADHWLGIKYIIKYITKVHPFTTTANQQVANSEQRTGFTGRSRQATKSTKQITIHIGGICTRCLR